MELIIKGANYPISLPFIEKYSMRSTDSSLRLPSRRLASGNKIRVSDSANIFVTVYLYKKDNTYISISTNQIITLADNYDNVFFYKSSALGVADEVKIEIFGDNVVYDELFITCDAQYNTYQPLSQNVISGDMIVEYTLSQGTYSDGYFSADGNTPLQMVDYTKLVNRLNIGNTYNEFKALMSGATNALITFKVWRPIN